MGEHAVRPCLGISSCLLGQRVRYDGGHKHDASLVEALSSRFDLLPICPEVGIGLGVPRPPIQLVLEADGVHARGLLDPVLDVTQSLHGYARDLTPALERLCGYVCKARSPSCGLGSTPLLAADGATRLDSGLFAAAVRAAFPDLPMAEEDQLRDSVLRERFITQALAYQSSRPLDSSILE